MTAVVTLYGIPNCDQVRLARAWLGSHRIEYRFHDFKREGLAPGVATRWLELAGASNLINRKGTTWRKLADQQRADAETPAGACALMVSNPSVVKRPLLDIDGHLTIGFAPNTYETLF